MERSFITWEFCGIFCTLCVTIFNARVPFFRFSDLRNTLLITCMLLCSSFLAPVFWQLWIYAGSANANFFFAITLAYSTAQVISVLMVRYFTPVGNFNGERLPYENPILPGPNLWTRSCNRLVIKGLNFHKGLFLKPNCFLVILIPSEFSICVCTFTTKFLENFLHVRFWIYNQMVVLSWAIVNLVQ